MSDEFKKIEEQSKKRNKTVGEVGVKVMAAFLAFLMVLSVTATAISLIFVKA
ncbi:MAG: hypothetical protein IJH12_07430 [Clostridia bacterium]|nr:hypothetical protein [Clostridia bacterium]